MRVVPKTAVTTENEIADETLPSLDSSPLSASCCEPATTMQFRTSMIGAVFVRSPNRTVIRGPRTSTGTSCDIHASYEQTRGNVLEY
eukprot:scaffold273131_cov18-Prasinocladus_malaysianus.AAC.1